MSVYFPISFKSVHNKRYLLFHIKNCICLENVYVQKCLNFIKFSLKRLLVGVDWDVADLFRRLDCSSSCRALPKDP